MTLARILTLFLTACVGSTLAAAELRFEVRHERALRDHSGILTIDDTGVSYQQGRAGKQQKKTVHFDYQDIQELRLSPDKLVLVTYIDRKWFMGMDKEYEFFVVGGRSFAEAYTMLKNTLDQRFIAALADPEPASYEDLDWDGGTWSGPTTGLGLRCAVEDH